MQASCCPVWALQLTTTYNDSYVYMYMYMYVYVHMNMNVHCTCIPVLV